MDFRDYYKFVEELRSTDFNAPDTAGLHGLIGLQSELGELADLYKKHMWRGRDIARDDIIDECGDILYYLQMTLASVGSNLDEAKDRNATKLKFRQTNGKNKEAEKEHVMKVVNG